MGTKRRTKSPCKTIKPVILWNQNGCFHYLSIYSFIFFLRVAFVGWHTVLSQI